MSSDYPDTGFRYLPRIVFKVVILVPWTLALFGIRLAVSPLALFSPRLDLRIRRRLCRICGHGMTRVLGFRVSILGTPPEPPFLLVSNHLTTVDSVLYLWQLGCIFVAMAEMKSWPIIGFIAAKVGNLFIDRKQLRDTVRVNALVAAAYERGEGIMVYPEAGTSSGRAVAPFKPALLESAAREGWPVYYAAIRHATPEGFPPASWAVCWVGDTPFFTHLRRLLSLPAIETTITFGPAPVYGQDRKTLAADLEAAVKRLFVPMD